MRMRRGAGDVEGRVESLDEKSDLAAAWRAWRAKQEERAGGERGRGKREEGSIGLVHGEGRRLIDWEGREQEWRGRGRGESGERGRSRSSMARTCVRAHVHVCVCEGAGVLEGESGG